MQKITGGLSSDLWPDANLHHAALCTSTGCTPNIRNLLQM